MSLLRMSRFEKSELALIFILAICTWLFNSMLPEQLPLGSLILTMSALLLLQGLIRDLFLITNQSAKRSKQRREMRCMCLESTIGMTGVIIGAGVVGMGINQLIMVNQYTWVGLIVLMMIISFLIKDFIIQSKPWRITYEKDHLNIMVKWN